jgi:hypothetical protein
MKGSFQFSGNTTLEGLKTNCWKVFTELTFQLVGEMSKNYWSYMHIALSMQYNCRCSGHAPRMRNIPKYYRKMFYEYQMNSKQVHNRVDDRRDMLRAFGLCRISRKVCFKEKLSNSDDQESSCFTAIQITAAPEIFFTSHVCQFLVVNIGRLLSSKENYRLHTL